jgi:hypothetical protein
VTFRREVDLKNRSTEVGKQHLVLIEGRSKRWTPEAPTLTGRTDTNKVSRGHRGSLKAVDDQRKRRFVWGFVQVRRSGNCGCEWAGLRH